MPRLELEIELDMTGIWQTISNIHKTIRKEVFISSDAPRNLAKLNELPRVEVQYDWITKL